MWCPLHGLPQRGSSIGVFTFCVFGRKGFPPHAGPPSGPTPQRSSAAPSGAPSLWKQNNTPAGCENAHMAGNQRPARRSQQAASRPRPSSLAQCARGKSRNENSGLKGLRCVCGSAGRACACVRPMFTEAPGKCSVFLERPAWSRSSLWKCSVVFPRPPQRISAGGRPRRPDGHRGRGPLTPRVCVCRGARRRRYSKRRAHNPLALSWSR